MSNSSKTSSEDSREGSHQETDQESFPAAQAAPGCIITTEPPTPVLRLVSNDGKAARVRWEIDEPNAIQFYTVMIEAKGKKEERIVFANETILDDMKPGCLYGVCVCAQIKDSKGPTSEVLAFPSAPLPPLNVHADHNPLSPEDSVFVKFKDPDSRDKEYVVTIDDLTDGASNPTSQITGKTTLPIKGLKPEGLYRVYVQARIESTIGGKFLISARAHCNDEIRTCGGAPEDVKMDAKKVLGRGGFGKVYAGTYKGKQVAIKRMDADAESFKRFEKEMAIISECSHENIIRYLYWYNNEDHVFMILERCHYTVNDFINRTDERFAGLSKEQILFESASGIHYLHNKYPFHIVHRDIKPSNILLLEVSPAVYRVKIVDFGISIPLEFDASSATASNTGTGGYKSSEELNCAQGQKPRARKESDIFSLGIVFFKVMNGTHPFGKQSFECDLCIKNKYPPLENIDPLIFGEDMAALVLEMLNHNFKSRPDSTEVKQRTLKAALTSSSKTEKCIRKRNTTVSNDDPGRVVVELQSQNKSGLNFVWKPPHCDMEEYQIDWKRDEEDSQKLTTEKCKFRIQNPFPGCYYSVRVAARNSAGIGKKSDWTTVLTAPGNIESISAKQVDENVVFEWDFLDNVIEKYQLEWSMDSGDPFAAETIASHYRTEDATPSHSYHIRVRAINKTGPGEWSDWKTFECVPGRMSNVTLEGQFPNSIKLRWDPPLPNTPKEYVLEMMDRKIKFYTKENAYEQKGLKPATTYRFRIGGINETGSGELSDWTDAYTAPIPPKITDVKPVSKGNLRSFAVTLEDESNAEKMYIVKAKPLNPKYDEVIIKKVENGLISMA